MHFYKLLNNISDKVRKMIMTILNEFFRTLEIIVVPLDFNLYVINMICSRLKVCMWENHHITSTVAITLDIFSRFLAFLNTSLFLPLISTCICIVLHVLKRIHIWKNTCKDFFKSCIGINSLINLQYGQCHEITPRQKVHILGC